MQILPGRLQNPIPGLLLCGFLAISISTAQAQLRNSFDAMVVNRRQVSHILFETRYEQNVITLILHHAGIWAYQARSHALHKKCGTYSNCLSELKRLNHHLKSGKNMRLHIQGSAITGIEFAK